MPQLDTGNTGFMLLCASLVMLMTPGLAFFYGGLVGRTLSSTDGIKRTYLGVGVKLLIDPDKRK